METITIDNDNVSHVIGLVPDDSAVCSAVRYHFSLLLCVFRVLVVLVQPLAHGNYLGWHPSWTGEVEGMVLQLWSNETEY